MKPKQFVLLAIAAAVSSLLAIASWLLQNQWSSGLVAGSRLLPAFAADAGRVASLEIKQAGTTLTLEKTGAVWGVKERAGYPADAEKVRALMVRLSQADLLEVTTRKADRYALVELEDPAAKDAKSRGLRALDAKGGVIADVVLGKRRADAFGAGKGGTYVRKPGDPQTWLASGEIETPLAARDWIKPQVLDIDHAKVNKLTLEIEGEEPLNIERSADKDAKIAFVGLPPEGKKLKDAYAADSLIRAASQIELEDVRKIAAPPAGKDVSKLTFETASGLKALYTLRKEPDAYYYVTITASGDGDARKEADVINARVGGWEYKISPGKGESLLKRRADLIDDKAS